MNPSWRDCFMAHGRTHGYHSRIASALGTIERSAKKRRGYVAFSGGKDSTVMLHLVARVLTDFDVIHFDMGRPGPGLSNVFPADLERSILDSATTIGGKPVVVLTKQRYWTRVDAHDDRPAGTRVEFVPDDSNWIGATARFAREQLGCAISFVGLRRQESARRRVRIDNQVSLAGAKEVWPVAKLTEMDVWATIVLNDLPYPKYYDVRADLSDRGYIGLRMTSLFRSAGTCGINDRAVDTFLNWRDMHG